MSSTAGEGSKWSSWQISCNWHNIIGLDKYFWRKTAWSWNFECEAVDVLVVGSLLVWSCWFIIGELFGSSVDWSSTNVRGYFVKKRRRDSVNIISSERV